MYKRLFNEEYEGYIPRASHACAELDDVIRPIVNKLIEEGFSIRDIERILVEECIMICNESLLIRNFELVKRGKIK